ncbi:acyltransferase family protein [Pseudomonas viridiflava]|uniref:acyltransferase family protein n=1 Tax=Pseudomonas viridiflava TaxID=33069 RepID=UPI000F026583|nr:acyltransferase [Pseudomonas viridiflava]
MKNTRYYEAADGIRGLACVIVLITHAIVLFFNDLAMAFSGTGKIGVWLFFVLSAFLLTAKFESGGFSVYSISTYAIGRVVRIIPIFMIALIFYYVMGTAGIDSELDLQSAILFSKGYAHLWTIPVEFKFYLVLPVIAYALTKAKECGGHSAVIVAALAMIMVQQMLWPYWQTTENNIDTRWYLSSFTIGCYFASSFTVYSSRITSRTASVIGLSVLILMVLSSPIMRNITLDMPMDRWLQNKFVYLSLLWGIFVVALADGKGIIGALLKSRIMKMLGAWSFSIYLAHWYFYVKLGLLYPNSVLWMFVGIGCAVVFGAALHYLVESPIEKFRHHVQLRMRDKKAAAV